MSRVVLWSAFQVTSVNLHDSGQRGWQSRLKTDDAVLVTDEMASCRWMSSTPRRRPRGAPWRRPTAPLLQQ